MNRAERLAQILALRAEGLTKPQIAKRLGVSHSTVRNIISDPDGSKQRARRDTYSGTCIDCGRATRSDGTSKASDRCRACSGSFFQPKQWTREAVILAIQRFAEANGRPPIADEWTTSDPEHGYPPRSAVYRSTDKRSTAPFQSWREAIETACPGYSAGSGRRTYKEVHMDNYDRKGYTVLREVEGHWEIVGESDEGTQTGALNATLNGHEPEGRWIAVPNRYWRPRALAPRTIYDWVEETA